MTKNDEVDDKSILGETGYGMETTKKSMPGDAPKMELNRAFKVTMRRAVTVSNETNVKQVIQLAYGCVRWGMPNFLLVKCCAFAFAAFNRNIYEYVGNQAVY